MPLIPLLLRSALSPSLVSPGFQGLCQVFRPGGATGPSTTTTVAIATGTHSPAPASMYGIRVGMQLRVGRGTGNAETVTVTAVTSTTFTATFAHTHSIGDAIDGALAGSQNLLIDLSNQTTQATWNDYQQGGLSDATVQLVMPYEDILDIVFGNWLLFGFLGGNLDGTHAAGSSVLELVGYTDDLGNQYLTAGDVVMISDGINTDLMSVTGTTIIGHNLQVTLAAAPGQPNTTTLNSYGSGTQVVRLCYQGVITTRLRNTRIDNQFFITAMGMFNRYTNAMANLDIIRQDTGFAIYQLAQSFAGTLPEIVFNGSNFAGTLPNHTTGILGTTQGTNTFLSQGLSDLLRQENAAIAGTAYAMWVDQSRQVFHQQIPTVGAGSSPTQVADLEDGGTGDSTADVLGPLVTTDMDGTALCNAVIIEGGQQSDGTQLKVIVRDLTSIGQWGFYEGSLQNPNLTDPASLAAWGQAQLALLAYPANNSTLSYIVSSLRINSRDLLEITGFDDLSTTTTNVVQVQYKIDMQTRVATAQLQLSQLSSDAGTVMREIASEYAYRQSNQGSNANLIGAFVVSGFDITTGVNTFTIAAGVVSVGGVLYNIPALSGTTTTYLNGNALAIQFGAQTSTPAIVQMPTILTLSSMSAPYSYDITGGVLSGPTSLGGLSLWRITTLNNGEIVGTRDLRNWGGVNNNNMPANALDLSTASLSSLTLAAEGLASVDAKVIVSLPAGFVGATWLREVSLVASIVGLNLWETKTTLSNFTSTTATFKAHGFAAGQSYDLGLVAVALNGQMTAVKLLGTSPTISSAAITAALLTYNEWSPAGVLQADGSFTNVDGHVGNTSFASAAAGDVITVTGSLKAAAAGAAITGFDVGDFTALNYYHVLLDNSNTLRISAVVSGSGTLIKSLSGITYDTNRHTYRVVIVLGSPNKIQLSYDNTTIIISDSTVSMSSVSAKIFTGGSAGSVVGYNFTKGNTPLPSSGGMNNQGSIPPLGGMPQVNWSQTSGAGPSTDSITFTTSATTAVFGDGTSIALPALNQTFTGLQNSANYFWDIAFDIPSNTWFVGHAAVNTHQTSLQQGTDCFSDGRLPCAADFMIATLVAGVGGGGGGTGGGSCPATYQLIETQESGFIRADKLQVGMHLRDPYHGWNEIYSVQILPTTLWEIQTAVETVTVNATHAVMDFDGKWHDVRHLKVGTKLKAYPQGSVDVIGVRSIGPGEYVAISCGLSQYVLGKQIGHNATPTCPSVDQIIETLEWGFVPAQTLQPGDHLRDPEDGWNEILMVGIKSTILYRVVTEVEAVEVNDTHAMMLDDGRWMDVKHLQQAVARGNVFLRSWPMGRVALKAVELIGPGDYVPIECERNRYVLGHGIGHNFTY